MNRGSRAAIALAVIVALLCVCTVAIAARNRMSKPSAMGAGKAPMARAASTSDEAWIYTNEFGASTPMQTSGSIQITAIKGVKIDQDKAEAVAHFTWDNAKYTLRVTCPYPLSGQDFPGHGPVQFLRSVLGTNDLGTLNLPETHAHVAVYGRTTIKKDGKLVVDNQPTVVLVTQAIHSTDQQLLTSPVTDRNEIQLIVPGPLSGQTFVKGFPNGYFYIYWPNVKLTLSGDVEPTMTMPSTTGRGPARPITGTEEPQGTIDISLTNKGFTKSVYETPTGLYILSITNNSSRARGVLITGQDLCCTKYSRFSTVLKPGGKQTFRWYFAPGKVVLRDYYGGTKTATSYRHVKFAGHSSSFMFQ